MTKSPKLSIVILNYNTGNYLLNCLKSIYASSLSPSGYEIILVDNASTDNSLSQIKPFTNLLKTKNFQIIINPKNLGFSAGNNVGVRLANPNSRYLLFLNPDTLVNPDTLRRMLRFFSQNPKVDAATCKIILASTGAVQPECHRSFPTPLSSLLYFSGISRRFYFAKHLDFSQTQKIDACSGSFLMIKKSVGDRLAWWNEKYFFYGEDLDLCYKLKQHAYQLYYYPFTSITHYQGISSGIKKTKSTASRATKILAVQSSTQAMKIFFQENLADHYPRSLRWLVWAGIALLEKYRVLKAKYL
jgi:GT2 family glycosyltransferase